MLRKRKISAWLKKAIDEEVEKINAEDEIDPRREPDSVPPREDVKKRYKKDDIPKDDREDYKDTLYDKALKPEK